MGFTMRTDWRACCDFSGAFRGPLPELGSLPPSSELSVDTVELEVEVSFAEIKSHQG